jgi:predicted RecB family nuclease
MHNSPRGLSLSATDLSNFLGCRHLTALELERAAGVRDKPYVQDPLLHLLFKRGLDHEKEHVDSLGASGLTVVDLTGLEDADGIVKATLEAMQKGADIIFQGALRLEQWFGRPDLLIRVARPSGKWAWSYEVSDTKLARETRAGAILQLGLYSEMLGVGQGSLPERFHVVTPHGDHHFRVNDFSAYLRLVRGELATTVLRPAEDIAREYYPEPVEHCQICAWLRICKDKRRADDHLSLVAGITRGQRRDLEERGIATLTQLARMPLPIAFRPARSSAESLTKSREQARLQLDSRGKMLPLHELRDIVAKEGLCRLPVPTPGDVFLDLEGDNLAFEGGREYLFGLVTVGCDGAASYQSFWGRSDHEERVAFETVMDLFGRVIAAHPEMHVYHYAPYEQTQFKRLMGRYGTRENELDDMLRAERFVDLYAVMRQGVRAGIERYSIKKLEPLYGYVREVSLEDADRGLNAFVYALALGDLAALNGEVCATVEGYNRDDCISTLRLRDWLENVRRDAIADGHVIPRPKAKIIEQTEAKTERQRRLEDLGTRLLDGIEGEPAGDTPERARWLLSHLLEFHHREWKAPWWKYYELRDSSDEELLDEPAAASGLEFDERVMVNVTKSGKPTGTVVDRYRYPPQEMEIRRKADLMLRDESSFGEVVAVDRMARTIEIKKTRAHVNTHPVAIFAHKSVRVGVLEEAIERLAATATTADLAGMNGIARTLLLRQPPRLTGGAFLQPGHAIFPTFAIETVNRLDRSVLAIQGPPGSGKTYTGARMIVALIAEGKKVGVLATSHKVIVNLLAEAVRAGAAANVSVRAARKGDDDDSGLADAGIRLLSDNAEVVRALASGDANLMGGTAWLWSREDMAHAIDVVFVDEAGQVSLGNALAVSGAAASMVLLGDPQQLDHPYQGSHPDCAMLSALQHVMGEHSTIPSDRGIFLDTTWRLAPSICRFTSELFYESRLEPKAGLELQAIAGVAGLSGSGLWYADVDHDGHTNASEEEAEVVASLVSRLIAPGAHWITPRGTPCPLMLRDILIVSPFNAQVSRLTERLSAGARVGTVDKFQGQEAPVVIYSMATSRPEDAPRGMDFLYSLNRFNVATSRARCAVIVVANPRLYAPDCHSPEQMRLANALCRYRELATELHVE